jgi:hypothetical protein
MPGYVIYDIQLQNLDVGDSELTAGGAVIVCTAGTPRKATIFNADTFASLANPLTPTRGKIRFATLDTVDTVDIYGIDGSGRALRRLGVKAGKPTEFFQPNRQDHVLRIPFAIEDTAANVETNTGIDFPVHAVVLPTPIVLVTTAEASRTLNVGLLSTGTGGNASGFLDAVSLATAGPVQGTHAASLGALLREAFATTPAVRTPRPHLFTGNNTRRVTYTFSASTANAQGFIDLPYRLHAAA